MRGTNPHCTAQPLFFTFPDDTKTYKINSQFLIGGRGVMASPILEAGVVSVSAYFPRGNWFDMFNYSNSVSASSVGMNFTRSQYSAPPDHINVRIREGNILVLQGEAMATRAARAMPFHLLVVMSDEGASTGELFLDDGVDINMGRVTGQWSLIRFSAKLGTHNVNISSCVVNGGFAMTQKWIIEKVTILGLRKKVNIKDYYTLDGAMNKDKEIIGLKSSYDTKGEFVASGISNLKLLVGQHFNLELTF